MKPEIRISGFFIEGEEQMKRLRDFERKLNAISEEFLTSLAPSISINWEYNTFKDVTLNADHPLDVALQQDFARQGAKVKEVAPREDKSDT